MNKNKNIYSLYTQDELWLIKESEWQKDLQWIRESQFTLGNGYLGTRGIYEEIPYDCRPGTYVVGLYDKMAAQVSELVNLPNPVNFKFSIGGEKLAVIAMDILDHKRALNMKKGLLARHTLYSDSKGKRYDYQSLRFISQQNKNIGVMQVILTPLDSGCVVDVNTGIDTSVSNSGMLSEGKKKHFRVRELGQRDGAGFLVTETFEKRYTIIYWSGFYYYINGEKIVAEDNIFRLKLKKNQTVVFTKVFCIKHFQRKKDHAAQKKDAFRIFSGAFKTDFAVLLKEHIDAWDKLWKKADIIIGQTANIQQNMRFNIYHMLICAHYDNGASGIGARALSGEGYRGHIFWDAEIFLMPFYLFTFPKIAKNMLLYRYRRLDKARAIARRGGFKGAQFPWESADTGDEETPEWARDIDRTIIRIHTHEMEHHLSADIAYAIYRYYIVTADEQFMEKYGFEMLIEIARFWASRVEWNEKKRSYEIRHIIGPDEFHIDIDNNAFTNMMAKWVLITAARLINNIKKKAPLYKNLKKKLDLSDKETKKWKQIASKILIKINKNKIIEQFSGFFRLENVMLTRTDENGIPLIPVKIRAKDLSKTQLVKQADALMLLILLDDVFSAQTKIANYQFYMPRTAHRSSLSAAMHALIASEVGDLQKAYNLFNLSLRTDISNLFGNTYEGIHAACLGGTWQALVFGFAGIKVKKEELSIDPRMPRSWRKLIFNLMWKGDSIELELSNEAIKIKVCSKAKNVRIGIFNKPLCLKTNKAHHLNRQKLGYQKCEKEIYY